jgi:branched-chain amino acid transport system substrate-binding protein
MRMAVAELNEAGGVLGRPVEFVERDDRNNPAEAISAFRFLAEREGISAAGGVISSDVALAASREAEALRVPLFLTMAGSHAILRKSSRFTFRTCLVSAPMFVQAVAAYVQYARFRRVGAIVADYAWGRAIQEALERYIGGLDGVRLQTEVAPVGVSDFTPYLRRLQGFGPEFLVATGHPPGQPTIVRQAAELGMPGKVVGSAQVPEVMVQRAGDSVLSRFLDYSCVDFTSPAYRQLAARYYATYRRHMDSSAFSGYVIVRMVADAARRAGSMDPRAVAETVRRGRFTQPGYAFPLSYTEWGELKEARPIFFTIERGDSGVVCPGCGWSQKYQFRSSQIQPYVPAE